MRIVCYTDIAALANDWVTFKPVGVYTILFVQKAPSVRPGSAADKSGV